MSRRIKLSPRLCRSFLVIAGLASCGPPLTDPSSQNLSGRWVTTDGIGPLYNVAMIITQRTDGTISGTWTANVSPPHPFCPPGLGNPTDGTLTGANTVLEVRLALLGAGDFAGQAIDSKTIKGSFVSCDIVYAVRFSFVGPAPSP